jgi:hypothetical protein
MDTFGLMLHDDQLFLAKVVELGTEKGIFTRDLADEIIRVSVAMANKYVVDKEVDFRSEDELVRVQETILKLVGLGLEIKCKGDSEEGLRYLTELSPVDLFRIAYTRVEKLRNRWGKLLLNHRIDFVVNRDEFPCLSEFTIHRFSEMSIFKESEIYNIKSLTLPDELFTGLSILEYYESEAERYEFLLRLKDLLPFDMLRRSPNSRAENIAEADSVREALINTLIVSSYCDSSDPVVLSTSDVRTFLADIEPSMEEELFSDQMEETIIDVIHELAEGLLESEAALLANEVIETSKKLLLTIRNEWKTVSSQSENTFFKRWVRMVILSDAETDIDRIISSCQMLDAFDFEVLLHEINHRDNRVISQLINKIPWNLLTASQTISLFHQAEGHQKRLAKHISLQGLSAMEILELLEGIDTDVFRLLKPALKATLSQAGYSLQDLEIFAALPEREQIQILRMANTPVDLDETTALREFRDGTKNIKRTVFFACLGGALFSNLFAEAWVGNPSLVKRWAQNLNTAGLLDLVLSASDGQTPLIQAKPSGEETIIFNLDEVDEFVKSLPESKKKALVKYFK